MNVFISFDWSDRDQVNGFRGMLANPQVDDLQHRDFSLRFDYGALGNAAIRQGILAKLTRSHVTVCLISQKTRHSDWVNWELEQSRAHRLGIVGLVLPDQPVATLAGCPEFFTRYSGYTVYPWAVPAQIHGYISQAWANR